MSPRPRKPADKSATAVKAGRSRTARSKKGRRTAEVASPAAARPGSELLASQIDRASGISVWRQIASDLEAEIVSGRLKAGTRLPTEQELASHYSVNRHTLRRAIAELSQSGLVTATPRRGTFVAMSRLSYPIASMTRFSESVVSAGQAPSSSLIDWRRATAPIEMASWLGIAATNEVIELRHIRLANDTPICLATAWFPADRFARIASAYEKTGSITKALARLGVREYSRHRTRVTARQATPEERELLRLPRNGLLLVTETLDVDSDSVPIQASHSCFAADRVELLIET